MTWQLLIQQGPIHPSTCACDRQTRNRRRGFYLRRRYARIWAARYLTMNGKRRLLVPQPWIDGQRVADAIGAQAAYPGRQVISMSGDGGFSMLMGDVITLKQEKLR